MPPSVLTLLDAGKFRTRLLALSRFRVPQSPTVLLCPSTLIAFLVITDGPGEFLGTQDPEGWRHPGTDSQRKCCNVYYKSLIVTFTQGQSRQSLGRIHRSSYPWP